MKINAFKSYTNFEVGMISQPLAPCSLILNLLKQQQITFLKETNSVKVDLEKFTRYTSH